MTHPHLEGLIPLYHAVNRMMARIGLQGEVSSKDAESVAVMDALFAIDGGRYDEALAALPGGGVDGWQPMESAPLDGTNVLLVNRKGNVAAGLFQGRAGFNRGWWLRGGNKPDVFFNDHHGPTHWMPLPSLPTPNPHEADRNG